jgi:hypothetical protein
MSGIPANELKILIAKSAGRCAFRGCGKILVTPSLEGADPVFSGEACHIVAQSRQGPRGNIVVTEGQRDLHTNLILMCQEHHLLIDRRPEVYSVGVLRTIKAEHEKKFAGAESQVLQAPEIQSEMLRSTCFAVTQMPGQVFSAPCAFKAGDEQEVRKRRRFDNYDGLTPFFLAEGKLFTLCDLRDKNNPFREVIANSKLAMSPVEQLSNDPEGTNRIVRLLNTALRQKLGREAITYDREHHRYYFLSKAAGQPRTFEYRSITDRKTSRNTVWQPKRKTGEPRKFWYHLAAGINFRKVSRQSWILTIRPERHLTKDGKEPYDSRYVGRRITSLKARMYNDKYLEEVHFWRYVLSDGKPEVHLTFGKQHFWVSMEMLAFSIRWPGIEGDTKRFTNVAFDDDLFSLSERRQAASDEFDDDYDEELDAEC